MSQLCHNLHHLFNKLPLFGFPFDTKMIPSNGVYILFENGEYAHETNRIVRIGTHTGDSQLRSRLQQHFVRENKDRSIFRKNIGRALLNKAKDPYLAIWELDSTTSEAKKKYSSLVDVEKQKQVEQQVTTYMQSNFHFVVFQVDGKDKRLELESKIISTVSSCRECKSSLEWLGHFSPKDKIRESGLWIVNELYKQPLTEDEYDNLEREFVR
jgi:hypothetical protein